MNTNRKNTMKTMAVLAALAVLASAASNAHAFNLELPGRAGKAGKMLDPKAQPKAKSKSSKACKDDRSENCCNERKESCHDEQPQGVLTLGFDLLHSTTTEDNHADTVLAGSSKKDNSTPIPATTPGANGLPTVPASMASSDKSYVIAFYADTDGIGHGFIKVRPNDKPGKWTGYGFYPNGKLYGELGQMENDWKHEWHHKVCFKISESQLQQVLQTVEDWKKKKYTLVGSNCVSFVMAVNSAIGTGIPSNWMDKPGTLDDKLKAYSEAITNPNGTTSAGEVDESKTPEKIIDKSK